MARSNIASVLLILGLALAPDHFDDLSGGLRSLFKKPDHELGQARLAQPGMSFLDLAKERPEAAVQVDGKPEVDEPSGAVIL